MGVGELILHACVRKKKKVEERERKREKRKRERERPSVVDVPDEARAFVSTNVCRDNLKETLF